MTGPDTVPLIIHGARKLDADGQVDDFWLATEGGRIAATGTGTGWRTRSADAQHELVDAKGQWLTPGFIDAHGHGGGGYSYSDGPAELFGALALHRSRGTTRSVISLVSAPIEELCGSLDWIANVVERDPLVLGSHLEGPFLSPARAGAHDPATLLEPQPDLVEELIGAARGTLRQLTIAPELPNAVEAIEVLTEAGVVAAVGHTDADYGQAARAFTAGARLLTHAFNAMNGIHHRRPGPVMAAFDNPNVVLELILDGIHVHPRVARLVFESAASRVALITDAMAAAGAAEGEYLLGDLDVSVVDGRALLTGTATLAGSTLTQDAALRIAIQTAGIDPGAAVEALTATPASVLGLAHTLGRLKAGFAADAVLLDRDWRVRRVWADGRGVAQPL